MKEQTNDQSMDVTINQSIHQAGRQALRGETSSKKKFRCREGETEQTKKERKKGKNREPTWPGIITADSNLATAFTGEKYVSSTPSRITRRQCMTMNLYLQIETKGSN
mmetsp:Transcript_12295/g.23839  ORF Transcript_12295/g.23839 Transcript_12295/m.23839 type:complete len:108 (-) Transcript_12295:7-330(-)